MNIAQYPITQYQYRSNPNFITTAYQDFVSGWSEFVVAAAGLRRQPVVWADKARSVLHPASEPADHQPAGTVSRLRLLTAAEG